MKEVSVKAKTFQVDVDLKATVNVLSYSEEDAREEAQTLAENIAVAAGRAGLNMEVRGVKPRAVLSAKEVP